MNSNKPVEVEATYESWRYKDRTSRKGESQANWYKWADQKVVTFKDEIAFQGNSILFYHRNKSASIFDVTVRQQVCTQ